MKGLSKQELSNYIVQLLLDCPQEHPKPESIQCCHPDGCTLHSSPDPEVTPPTLRRTHKLPSKHNRHSSLGRRNNPSNDQRNMLVNENMEALNSNNQNQSRGTQDQSYFNDIISAIDLLCDMRSLFNQALQSRETNMGEPLHIGDKAVHNTDKKSRPRFAGYERLEECVVTKCNKRVQTEASSMQYNQDENICHLSRGHGSVHSSTSRGLEDQANSYDRFMNRFCHHQTPSPLIPPRANLGTYKKIYTC
uniref:MutS2 protein n=1 Tax=Lygus hesperus TaxID=30085 RepID=A0A0A9XVP5_LYGHE